MARIEGSNISPFFAWCYENAISRWTSRRWSSVRKRLVVGYFRAFGSGSTISFGTRVLEPALISVGARTMIPNRSVLDGRGGLTIGDDVLLGFENIIISSTHESSSCDVPIRQQGMYEAPVVIGDDVWTGARVVIVPGVTIGSHSIIGAGSVVTRDIPEWSVAAGVPARVVRDRRDR